MLFQSKEPGTVLAKFDQFVQKIYNKQDEIVHKILGKQFQVIFIFFFFDFGFIHRLGSYKSFQDVAFLLFQDFLHQIVYCV